MSFDKLKDFQKESDKQLQIIENFHADLNMLGWPKTLYVASGAIFQNLVVALRVKVEWHFEEGTEGFPYFLIGPTMVRVENQGQPPSARILDDSNEEHFIDEWDKNTEIKATKDLLREKIVDMHEKGEMKIRISQEEIDARIESEKTT